MRSSVRLEFWLWFHDFIQTIGCHLCAGPVSHIKKKKKLITSSLSKEIPQLVNPRRYTLYIFYYFSRLILPAITMISPPLCVIIIKTWWKMSSRLFILISNGIYGSSYTLMPIPSRNAYVWAVVQLNNNNNNIMISPCCFASTHKTPTITLTFRSRRPNATCTSIILLLLQTSRWV